MFADFEGCTVLGNHSLLHLQIYINLPFFFNTQGGDQNESKNDGSDAGQEGSDAEDKPGDDDNEVDEEGGDDDEDEEVSHCSEES